MSSGGGAHARPGLGVMVLELALVATQLRLDMKERCVEGAMRIGALTFRFDDGMRIEMQRAVDSVERPIVGEHHISIGAAVKMLGDRLRKPHSHARRKRLADLNLFA